MNSGAEAGDEGVAEQQHPKVGDGEPETLPIWRQEEIGTESPGVHPRPFQQSSGSEEKKRDSRESGMSSIWREFEGAQSLASDRAIPRETSASSIPAKTKHSRSQYAAPRGTHPSSHSKKRDDSDRASSEKFIQGRSKPRRVRRAIKWTVTLAIALLVLDALWVGFGIFSNLRTVRTELLSARDELEDGEIDLARGHLETARDRVRTARSLEGHPAFWAVSFTSDAKAIEQLTSISDLLARSGLRAVGAARALGITGETAGAELYRDGHLDFEAVENGGAAANSIEGLLAQAAAELGEAPRPSLELIDEALEITRDEIANARSSVQDGRLLFSVLPGLFGEDRPRRYLLAFQAPGEARATGGLIGFFGVLLADEGTLNLERVASVKELSWADANAPAVEPPEKWFGNNYGPQNALRQVQQVNVSPNFPVVAETLLRMYQQTAGQNLDGVIAMDPVALADLLPAVGPIRGPGLDQDITDENVEDVIMYDSYFEFSDSEQNRFLAGLLQDFWDTIGSAEVDAAALATGIGEAVATQHFKLYSRDEKQQEALSGLGVHGHYDTAGKNLQMVFHNNYGENKIDYYMHREIDTNVRLAQGGDARITTSVTLTNESPNSPPSYFLGRNRGGDAPGLNRMYLNFLLPKGAEVHSFRPDANSGTTSPLLFEDTGHPVVWDYIEVQPGETKTVSTTYVLVDAAQLFDNQGMFDFSMFPQPAANPDRYSIEVSAPRGYVIGQNGVDSDGSFRASGLLDRPISFHLSVLPTADRTD